MNYDGILMLMGIGLLVLGGGLWKMSRELDDMFKSIIDITRVIDFLNKKILKMESNYNINSNNTSDNT